MASNTLTTTGDFTSFEVLAIVPGPPPTFEYWYLLRPITTEKYRYVALQRQATSGTVYLEIEELEVYV